MAPTHHCPINATATKGTITQGGLITRPTPDDIEAIMEHERKMKEFMGPVAK
jgi:hypothetical protein